EYLLVLNPDIHWEKKSNTLQKMIDFMKQNPRAAIMGPKQKLEDGSIEMTVRSFPSFLIQISRRTRLRKIPGLSTMVKKDEAEAKGLFRSKEVDWLQSSCILVRKNFWDEVGGFDENYKIFMADVELCFQAWKRDYKVMYYPEVHVYADGKRSSSGSFRNFFNNWILRQHFKDACKYHMKHIFERFPRRI
ncbi:glycosyltransferase family 2 protein, partial [Candidatus Peregrinibacteria bacterium]|nr:glycosyltransferase family 2 protein [Candidatus Peregrinibacteria bacterium]